MGERRNPAAIDVTGALESAWKEYSEAGQERTSFILAYDAYHQPFISQRRRTVGDSRLADHIGAVPSVWRVRVHGTSSIGLVLDRARLRYHLGKVI